jgi:ubiquinone/menaquinone biosynthesis C-methylase UbiE
MSDKREKYWNEQYLEYWRSRVQESGLGLSNIVSGDPNTEDNEIYDKIFSKNGFNAGNILDVGCAWGRMFDLYLKHSLKVFGIDISKAMIDAATGDWGNEKNVIDLRKSAAEKIPYKDDTFDNLACLAVFDATYQELSLVEYFRVVKPGGVIYLTGKNDNYFPDDRKALDAEKGARSKMHPNFFTNTALLMKYLKKQGYIIQDSYFFLYRGDFSSFKFETNIPDLFYEYMLVIKNTGVKSAMPNISSKFSKTFLKK